MSKVRVRYQTIEFGKSDIHIRTLRNRQEFHDPDGIAEEHGIFSATWSLFGVVWASGELLAHLMSSYDIQGLRILEVGCGIGLASLVLNNRDADITATDHHPEAGKFLKKNVLLNKGKDIPFVRANWSEPHNTLGKFDLIIGSDLLYEPNHSELLCRFINQHAAKNCKVILVDPGRAHYKDFTKNMTDLGYSCQDHPPVGVDELTQPLRSVDDFHILHFDR